MLGEAVGQEYVARYFPPEAKAKAREMVVNIVAAMDETVSQLDWMSPETKKKAKEKISTFDIKVGYPDKWKDYSSVTVTRDAYFDDVESASQIPGGRHDVHHRQAGGPRPLGPDASYFRRLLQSAGKRDRVSRQESCSLRPST